MQLNFTIDAGGIRVLMGSPAQTHQLVAYLDFDSQQTFWYHRVSREVETVIVEQLNCARQNLIHHDRDVEPVVLCPPSDSVH